MSFRRRLAPVLRRVLGRLKRRLRYRYDPLATPSYSQEGEDLILGRMFEGDRKGFYVDIGAHHPKRFSNTYLLYLQGWRGINVEPNPAVLSGFRRCRPRDVTLCVGVSRVDSELPYYEFADPALNTFEPSRALQVSGDPRHPIVDQKVIPVRRLDSLLRQHMPAGRRIDILSVDVEGHDLAVLESNDWARFRPRCIVVEAAGYSVATVDESEIHRFLASRQYELIAKTINTLIYRDATSF